MKRLIASLAVGAAASALMASGAFAAESGTIAKAVGGYTFEDAAKESPDTKNFHSKDGKLTFAIVTHTAGNGFFDPVYVGAKVAADAFGINLVMLGSEAPVDDIPREIEILVVIAEIRVRIDLGHVQRAAGVGGEIKPRFGIAVEPVHEVLVAHAHHFNSEVGGFL